MLHRSLLLALLFALAAPTLSAQTALGGVRNLDPGLFVHFGYGPHFPVGQLSDRFGTMFGIEMALDYSPGEGSPWFFGPEGQYLFGNTVFEDVLRNLRTTDGFVVGSDRSPADVQLRMRGYYAGVRALRIIRIGEQKRSGIRVSLGLGYLRHRIRLQPDAAQGVFQISDDYEAGYDRLTAGPAIHPFLGYQHLAASGKLNIYIGAESLIGFTTNLRDFDFALERRLDENRTDMTVGFRAGLILPFYIGDGEDRYY